MTWRYVEYTEKVGACSDLFNRYAKNIYRARLECGHDAQVMCATPPLKLDCMSCNRGTEQLPLPLFLPSATVAFK